MKTDKSLSLNTINKYYLRRASDNRYFLVMSESYNSFVIRLSELMIAKDRCGISEYQQYDHDHKQSEQSESM